MVNEYFKQWFVEQGIDVQKNGTLRDRGRRKVSVDDLLVQWMRLKRFREASGDWAPVEAEDIEDFVDDEHDRRWPPVTQGQTEEQKIQQALETFVTYFEEGYDIEYTGSSYILVKKGFRFKEQLSVKTAADEINLRMAANGQKKLSSEMATAAIENMIAEAKRNKKDDALKVVEYDPAVKNNGFSFKEWTEKLFAHYGIANTKLNRLMWRYFMHCIKRAAFGFKSPDFKMMFLIFSRVQGIGKSRLLKHLCDPFIGAFNPSATLYQMTDDNAIKALCSEGSALVDFQELGLGKGKDGTIDVAARLKQVITLEEHKSRGLYQTGNTTTMVTPVWSSSTNLHISEVVHDTDYRRYYVFESEMTKEQAIRKDWAEVDSFFADTLVDAYRFLDENTMPTISHETMEELRNVQESYARRVDIITQWLQESGMAIVDEEDSNKEDVRPMEISLLYKRFKSFLQNCGLPSYSRQRMQQLIASSCDILPSTDEDSKLVYYVKGGK